MPELQRVRRQE